MRSYDIMGRVSALVSTSVRLGAVRLYGQTDVATASQLRSTIDEYIQGSSSAEHAASLTDFAGKPLVVLTADIGNDPGWSAQQDALATLSTDSAHRVIDGATHASMISDENDAAATTQAILDVVSSVRNARPLGR